MGERILYLVRHGQLDMLAFKKDQFRAGLTPLGRKQARRTARKLRTLDVDAIHCSTLGRARETAEIIAREFPKIKLQPTHLLWELPNLGPPKNPTWRKVFAKGKQRGERAFNRFVRPTRRRHRVEILVSHGNLIRYFVCRALGIKPENWSPLGTSHCSITELRITPEKGIQVMCYNETGHLPARAKS